MMDGSKIVERLLNEGAKTNRYTNAGSSAFLLGAEECHNLLVISFLKAGVDANQKNQKTGQTALMSAARCGNYPMTKTLLEHHADTTLKDNSGFRALDYAQAAKFDYLVELLK